MPYQLITDADMRDRLARGEAHPVDGTAAVDHDGGHWLRTGDVWVRDDQPALARLRQRWRQRAESASGDPDGDEHLTGGGVRVSWRGPLICVATGFVATLLLLAVVAGNQHTRLPRVAAPAPVLPGPTAPVPPQTQPPGGIPNGDVPDDGPVPDPVDVPPVDPALPPSRDQDEEQELNQNQDQERPDGPGSKLVADVRPAEDRRRDPRAALADVARRIDRAAAQDKLSRPGQALLRRQVRQLDRALEGRRGRNRLRLVDGAGDLRRAVTGLALFRRIEPGAAVSIRIAVDRFERTLS